MIKGLVSIIIPIYNGKKWLKNAVNSALSQTYTNVEVILIDDGSTDDSWSICKEIAIDERVHVYRKMNEGGPSARNVGLDIAQGEYVQFLDCDDTLEEKACATAVEAMKQNTDIVLYGFNIYKNGELLRNPHCSRISYHGEFEKFKIVSQLLDSACNKLYRRNYIKKKFREGVVYGEDSIFNYDNLTNETKIECIDDCLYNVVLDNPVSVNKRYKKGRLCDTVVLVKTQLEKSLLLFGVDRNVDEYLPNSAKTLAFTVIFCASMSTYKDFSDELNFIQKEGYSNIFRILYKSDNIRLQHKMILFVAAHKSYKPLLYTISHLYKKFRF